MNRRFDSWLHRAVAITSSLGVTLGLGVTGGSANGPATDPRPLATGLWITTAPVDQKWKDRLSALATLEPLPKDAPSTVNVGPNAHALIKGLAGIQLGRYLDPEPGKVGKYSDWIAPAWDVLDTTYGFNEPKGSEKKLAEAAASIETTFTGHQPIYATALALLFFEHATASGQPRGKVDTGRDRPPSDRIRSPASQEMALVRTTGLLLSPNLTKASYAWDVNGKFQGGLWTYEGFARPDRWDSSVSGVAVMALASAANAGVFDLGEDAYKVGVPGGRTLSRETFVDRAADVTIHSLITLSGIDGPFKKGTDPYAGLKKSLDLKNYATSVRRHPTGARWIRIDLLHAGNEPPAKPLAYSYLAGQATAPDDWQNLYTTANGGYVLLTAANLLELLLRTPSNRDRPDEGRNAIGAIYRVRATGADGSGPWVGVAGTGAEGYTIELETGGAHTDLVVKRSGQDIGVDRQISRVVNMVASQLYTALGYEEIVEADGRLSIVRPAGKRVKEFWSQFHTVAPGFCQFNVVKFLLATRNPDSIGPVLWHEDFQLATERFFDAKEVTYDDHLFAILTATRAYRPLFISTPD
jgi:hypothetical protein